MNYIVSEECSKNYCFNVYRDFDEGKKTIESDEIITSE